MSKVIENITPTLQEWIAQQHLYFVATAPTADEGHINCSPKGLDTLRILSPHRAAYLDLTGSGAETIAHLRENGRIVLMFCALTGPPRIVRLHGRGRVVLPGTDDWAMLRPLFPAMPGDRSIIDISVSRVSDSCGYSVPRFAFEDNRDTLTRWAAGKGADGLSTYQREKNAQSIDGLPALSAPRSAPTEM